MGSFFLAVVTASVFITAALAVVGIWVSFGWWRPLVIAEAGLSLSLMTLFFGPAKLLPMARYLLILCGTLTSRQFAAPH